MAVGDRRVGRRDGDRAGHVEDPRRGGGRSVGETVLELLDPWLCRAFAPHNIEATLQRIADSQVSVADLRRVAAAREKIAACDTKLDRYRAALEAGTDPTLVQQWIAQIQVERALAEQDAGSLSGR